jgi:hypothetical protein
VWDLAQFPLTQKLPVLGAASPVERPRRTSDLDSLDRRFEQRTKDLFARARQARAASQAQPAATSGNQST